MNEILRECPFCGGEAKINALNRLYFRVECPHCYVGLLARPTREKAIATWNRRDRETALAARVATLQAELQAARAGRWWVPVESVGAVYANGEWPVIPNEYADSELRLCRLQPGQQSPVPDEVRKSIEATRDFALRHQSACATADSHWLFMQNIRRINEWLESQPGQQDEPAAP